MKKEILKEAIRQYLGEQKCIENKEDCYIIFNEFQKKNSNDEKFNYITFFTGCCAKKAESDAKFKTKDGKEYEICGILVTENDKQDYKLEAIIYDENKMKSAMKRFNFDNLFSLNQIGKYAEQNNFGFDGGRQDFKKPFGKKFKFKNGKLTFKKGSDDYMSMIMIYKITGWNDVGEFIEKGVGKYY